MYLYINNDDLTYCTGIFGYQNLEIIRTVSITDVTQSICSVNFETINNQPTASIQLMTTPTNMITMNSTLINPTDMIIMNDVFSSSTPLTIIVPSVVGGVLGLFIIFVCILALIIRSRKRQSGVKIGRFIPQSLSTIFKRYVCFFVIIMHMCDWI